MNSFSPLPPEPGKTTVAIIGGGASGVLMAAHLLSRSGDNLRVIIVEGRHMLGCGVAYSTTDPNHLLNTRVHNMSAYPGDPDHFRRWLAAQPGQQGAGGQCFVSRGVYGAYLSDLLAPWSAETESRRLRCIRETCVRIDDSGPRLVLHLENGRTVGADRVILATGHILPPPDPEGLLSGAWDHIDTLPADAAVVIIGSGLSMVDQVLSLLNTGHKGPIIAVSRRGLLPRDHAPVTPLKIAPADIPFGQPVSALFRWVRGLAARAEREGDTWRDAIDGIRPHVRALWQSLDTAQRQRFLRHGVAWWDVHRHRIPPQSAERIREAFDSGQLRQIRGAFVAARRTEDGGLAATLATRDGQIEIAAGRVIDCRGIRRDPVANATPLIADLLDRGAARVDPLRIGLDIGEDCALLDAKGTPSERIHAIGPVSRAAFWEITAIPDIREQTMELATRLVASEQTTAPA